MLLIAALTLLALLPVLALVLILAQPAYRRGRWYAYRDTVSAQVQACGLSLQIGGFLVGWAPESWFNGRQGRYRQTKLVIWAPISHAGSRFAFQVLILGRGVSFATPRERGNGSWAWPGDGLRLV